MCVFHADMRVSLNASTCVLVNPYSALSPERSCPFRFAKMQPTLSNFSPRNVFAVKSSVPLCHFILLWKGLWLSDNITTIYGNEYNKLQWGLFQKENVAEMVDAKFGVMVDLSIFAVRYATNRLIHRNKQGHRFLVFLRAARIHMD